MICALSLLHWTVQFFLLEFEFCHWSVFGNFSGIHWNND